MSTEQAIFAAGCFWGPEETLRRIEGVRRSEVGYTGGTTAHPTYEQVCTGQTGHAEAVRVEYDPDMVSYDQLLEIFFLQAHDPTQVNRQGPDVGTQYRSAIFYTDEAQKTAAERKTNELEQTGRFNNPIATEITPAGPFYPAEDYHQQFLAKRGRGACASTIVA